MGSHQRRDRRPKLTAVWRARRRDRIAYCRACSAKHDQRPPCAGCEFAPPHLTPAEDAIWQLWQRLQSQWRLSPQGTRLGLDLTALATAAPWYDLDLRLPWVRAGIFALETAELANA